MQINRKQNITIVLIGIVSIIIAIITFDLFFEKPNELSKKQIAELEKQIELKNEELKILEEQIARQKKTDTNSLIIINRLKEKIERDSIKLLKTKRFNSHSIQEKYDKQIKNAVRRADVYINKFKYDKKSHELHFKQLAKLYAVKGLSRSQNSDLRRAIENINDLYIDNVIPNKGNISQLDYVIKLYGLMTKITSNYCTYIQVNKIENEIIKNVKKTHTVKSGETLYSISNLYNSSQNKIKQNNFWKFKKTDNVKIDDIIIIEK